MAQRLRQVPQGHTSTVHDQKVMDRTPVRSNLECMVVASKWCLNHKYNYDYDAKLLTSHYLQLVGRVQ